MNQLMPQSINLSCSACAGVAFEVRALTDEGLANLKCGGCSRDYLLLDSEEYWFDVI
jgi:hypothetical protein